MGDVQGKHENDRDIKTVSPPDPRDRHGPPDRVAMDRSVLPSYQVPQTSSQVLVSVDSNVGSKRRKTLYGVENSGPTVLGREAKDTGRRKSQKVFRPTSLQPKSLCMVNKVLPLAEAITRGNSSEKQLLVFEDLDRVRIQQTVGSSSDRSSSESNSNRSRSSSSDSLVPRRWRQRWCIDEVGREQGQIRCIKDLCMLRCGAIVATEPNNIRLQAFSKTGKSLAVLGPDSEDLRSAMSFGYPLNSRMMQPTGVVEMVTDNIVAVTDLNRVLYIDATLHGMLNGEVILKGKTNLCGIATTKTSKLIVTEVSSQASVGLYENSGKLIREFKGNFRKPCYVANDPTYDITAVSDCEEGLVFLYDASGNLLTKFGASKNPTGNKSSAGHLVNPSGLCWSSQGRLLVADEVQKKVVAFDLRNLTAETLLSAENGLNRPMAVATDFWDSKNRIYVVEEICDFGENKSYMKMFEQRPTNC